MQSFSTTLGGTALLLSVSATAWANARMDHWENGVVLYHLKTASELEGTDDRRRPCAETSRSRSCPELEGGQCNDMCDIVEEAMARISKATPYVFIESSRPCAEGRADFVCVEIFSQQSLDEDGSLSEDGFGNPVFDGAYGGPARVNIARSGPGVIVHELIHALGFRHEHNRSDAERYIEYTPSCVSNDGLDPMPDRERLLLGPAEFGGNQADSSPGRSAPFEIQPQNDNAPTSIMAYSSYKGQSPFQRCFSYTNGDEVREPYNEAPDGSWRNWSCGAGAGQDGLPSNIQGCSGEDLALCNACRAGSEDGLLHLAWEQQTEASDAAVQIKENRGYMTYIDRAKVSRKTMDVDLDDLLLLDQLHGELRWSPIIRNGTSIDVGDSSRRQYVTGFEVPVVGYFNGDYTTDVLSYDYGTGESDLRVFTENGELKRIAEDIPLPAGQDIVLAGWFEDDTGSGQNVFDGNQDLVFYRRATGRTSVAHIEYDANRGTWKYREICQNEIDPLFDAAVVGTFKLRTWLSQVAMVKFDADGAVIVIFDQDANGCLAERRRLRAPRGQWTHVAGMHYEAFHKCEGSVCSGDKYTDLYFYDGAAQGPLTEARVMVADPNNLANEVVGFFGVDGGKPPAKADLLFAADLDTDPFQEMVFIDDDGTQTLSVLGRDTSGQTLTALGQRQIGEEGTQVTFTHAFVGQLPGVARPPTEATCGNHLIESDEVCDQSAAQISCEANQVAVCDSLCLSASCVTIPPSLQAAPTTSDKDDDGCSSTGGQPGALTLLVIGLLLVRFRKRSSIGL